MHCVGVTNQNHCTLLPRPHPLLLYLSCQRHPLLRNSVQLRCEAPHPICRDDPGGRRIISIRRNNNKRLIWDYNLIGKEESFVSCVIDLNCPSYHSCTSTILDQCSRTTATMNFLRGVAQADLVPRKVKYS